MAYVRIALVVVLSLGSVAGCTPPNVNDYEGAN